MKNEKILYVAKDFIKNKQLKNLVYIKDSFDDDTLGKIWRNYDFDKAEKKIFALQVKLTKAVFLKKYELQRKIQEKIVFSTEARFLAVRQVAEISKSAAGIDGISWRKDSEKMKAVINLNNGNYKAKPMKQFIFIDNKSSKKRQVGIPTNYDRAMQVLWAYALEPIAEARADRKSFAFRKGRSSEQAHAFIMDCLTDVDAPEWILTTDVESYYDTISHKWLLKNIPMNKYVLKQFLKSGFMFNGEFFDRESGISLGSNLSTILGNMTLDGLQYRLYSLQGKEIKDYKNGYCIRFADDIFITARTYADALKLKEEVVKFITERGLKISDKKTKIVNIKDGFEFLSRFYCKIYGVVRCIPSEKSVKKFEKEIEQIIFNSERKWTQNKLIQKLNLKINGFATYHKVEESMDVFKHLDVVINALLLKMLMKQYNNLSKEQLIKRYWKQDAEGRQTFTLTSNREKKLKNLADTVLIAERHIDSSKNIFLDKEYFEEIEKNKDIQNCVGRYKKVWDRQEGKCYICSKTIKKEQPKALIFKRNGKDHTIRNIAYVHTYCKDSLLEYVNVDEEDIHAVNLKEILAEIDNKKHKKYEKEGKFDNLRDYFHNSHKKTIRLTFKGIEKIIKSPLCESAYKRVGYYYNNTWGKIGESWTSQGYKISSINMEKQEIMFKKVSFEKSAVKIPKFMYRTDLPIEMKEDINNSLLKVAEKWSMKYR